MWEGEHIYCLLFAYHSMCGASCVPDLILKVALPLLHLLLPNTSNFVYILNECLLLLLIKCHGKVKGDGSGKSL